MNVRMNNKGFSLVELMVVVAIIGILAAVAVPQFSKFQAKSRQSEAKSSLAALYTAEKGFNAEYSGYASNLQAIGYSPTGEVLYNIGFGGAPCADWDNCAPAFEVANPATLVGDNTNADDICGAAGGAMSASGCRMKAAGAATGEVGPDAGANIAGTAAPTRISFTAGARAWIYSGFGTADNWTIDQNKLIQQNSNGIP